MEQVMNWIKDIFLMILSLTFFETVSYTHLYRLCGRV